MSWSAGGAAVARRIAPEPKLPTLPEGAPVEAPEPDAERSIERGAAPRSAEKPVAALPSLEQADPFASKSASGSATASLGVAVARETPAPTSGDAAPAAAPAPETPALDSVTLDRPAAGRGALAAPPVGRPAVDDTGADPGVEMQAVFRQSPSLLQPAVLFALVVAVGFGITIGYVLFGGEKVKIVREVVEVPARGPESEPAAPTTQAEVGLEAAPSVVEAAGARPATAKTTGSSAKVAVAPTEPSAGEGLTGLSGLKGLSAGPRTGPTGSAPTSSAQPLESGQIQGTVNRYTPAVRRSCWQPALDARDPSAPSSARVTVSLTIGPDGRVQHASAGGDPNGYPGLSSCITQRVRSWSFPASNGTTTVKVPFVFAAQ